MSLQLPGTLELPNSLDNSKELPHGITLESLYQTNNQSMWFLAWILKKNRFWPDLTREILEAPFALRRTNWSNSSSLYIFKNKRTYRNYEWYVNGQFCSETNWKNGKKHGPFRFWYANGQLNYEEYWKDNKHIDGFTYYFRENGQLWFQRCWQNGQNISSRIFEESLER